MTTRIAVRGRATAPRIRCRRCNRVVRVDPVQRAVGIDYAYAWCGTCDIEWLVSQRPDHFAGDCDQVENEGVDEDV